MPCSEKRARELLEAGRARVHRPTPFVIRLKDRTVEDSTLQPLRLGIDPGSKTTGLALSRVEETIDADGVIEPVMHICFLMELIHRGAVIKASLHSRAALRRGRRGRNLRYRAPRFDNRTKPEGWLAPSLSHRLETTQSWVRRISAWAPVTEFGYELVKFDLQKMENPEISGVEYQQGTLAGFELREYLLEKFQHQCVYCDATDGPLNLDHVQAKANGGSNRVSNLALACVPCNSKKNARDVRDFLKNDPARLARVLDRVKAPLRDAAAVNGTRKALLARVKAQGLPVEVASGGKTKFNRTRLGLPKSHCLDAACVGTVANVTNAHLKVLTVKCRGRGSRQRTRVDGFGFPRGYLMRTKSVHGFRTGDVVRATVPASSKKAGVHSGRVAVRKTGRFNIQTKDGVVQGVSHKHCRVLMRGDGYAYALTDSAFQQPKGPPRQHSQAPFLPALKDGVSRSKFG